MLHYNTIVEIVISLADQAVGLNENVKRQIREQAEDAVLRAEKAQAEANKAATAVANPNIVKTEVISSSPVIKEVSGK